MSPHLEANPIAPIVVGKCAHYCPGRAWVPEPRDAPVWIWDCPAQPPRRPLPPGSGAAFSGHCLVVAVDPAPGGQRPTCLLLLLLPCWQLPATARPSAPVRPIIDHIYSFATGAMKPLENVATIVIVGPARPLPISPYYYLLPTREQDFIL